MLKTEILGGYSFAGYGCRPDRTRAFVVFMI